MAQIYRGPGQISLVNLADRKERLKPGTNTPPNDARRAETALAGISPTPPRSTPSCSTTWQRVESSPSVPHRGQAEATPMNQKNSQQHQAAIQAPQINPAMNRRPWLPLPLPQAIPNEPQAQPGALLGRGAAMSMSHKVRLILSIAV